MKIDLRSTAYQYIKTKILNNEYVSQQIINEKDIADELGISKTPVKEALLFLERENFVVIHPRKSISVKEVDLKLIKDIFQIRTRIEPLLVELTLNFMNKTLLFEALLAFKEKFKQLTIIDNISNDEFDFLYDHYRYFFAENCGNSFLSTQMKLVYDHLHRIRRVLYGNTARRLKAIDEHIHIIDLICSDTSFYIIKELCEKHIEEAQLDFFKNLENLNL